MKLKLKQILDPRGFVIAFVLMLLFSLLTACAQSPLQALRTGYRTAGAYVDVTATSMQRSRITPAQARQASENAKTIRVTLDTARDALLGCASDPCQGYLSAMQSIQPLLLQLEAELVKQQGAQK